MLRPIPAPGCAEDDWPAPEVVGDGAVVRFNWHEDRGSRIATIRSATDFDLDAPFAADTNCFDDALGVVEFDNDLAEVIKLLATDALERGADFPVKRQIGGWTWSDDEPFRVKVLESGAGRFEPVPPHSFGASDTDAQACVVCGCHPSNRVHQ